MSDFSAFKLVSPIVRQNAQAAVLEAPEGYEVFIKEPRRNSFQNAALHGLIADVVRAKTEWAGQEWDIDSWRAIFASGYAKAVNLPVQTIPGLEGEFVAIRPSTARMSKSELSALIEYITAFCMQRDIPIRDTHHAA